jgi:hypothetical protein
MSNAQPSSTIAPIAMRNRPAEGVMRREYRGCKGFCDTAGTGRGIAVRILRRVAGTSSVSAQADRETGATAEACRRREWRGIREIAHTFASTDLKEIHG